MAGTEPIGTKVQNFITDNLVFELEAKTSLGIQGGVKSSVGNLEASLGAFDVAGINIDFINGISKGGWLNEVSNTRYSAGILGGIGFKGTPLSVNAGVEHSWIDKGNNEVFGYNNVTASTRAVGQVGFFRRGNGFGQNSLMKGGSLTGSVKSSCGGCINIGIGAKAIIGAEVNLKIGIK